MYGTRCPKCNHLIKPEQEAQFVRDAKEKRQSLLAEYLPVIRKNMKKEIEEQKNAD